LNNEQTFSTIVHFIADLSSEVHDFKVILP